MKKSAPQYIKASTLTDIHGYDGYAPGLPRTGGILVFRRMNTRLSSMLYISIVSITRVQNFHTNYLTYNPNNLVQHQQHCTAPHKKHQLLYARRICTQSSLNKNHTSRELCKPLVCTSWRVPRRTPRAEPSFEIQASWVLCGSFNESRRKTGAMWNIQEGDARVLLQKPVHIRASQGL